MPTATDQVIRRIAEQAGDVILSVDRDGVITYASPALRMFGYAPEDLVGRTGLDLIHPHDRARFVENTSALLRGEVIAGADRQHRILCADGRWAWVEGAPQLLRDAHGQVDGFVNVLRDVTARREQFDLFEAAFEHAAIGKALIGLDGRFLRVNSAFARMLGYSRTEVLGLDPQSLPFPEDVNADVDLRRRLTAGEIDSYTLDKRYFRRDGGCVWGRLSLSMVREVDGSPKLYIAQVQDLTGQREAEAALRDSEARHRVIAEATVDMITLATLDGVLTFVSPSVRQIGYEPEALVGSTFAANVHPDDRGVAWRGLMALMAGAPGERHRWRARHGVTGEWLWMESSPSVTRDPACGRPNGLIDVVRDITRQVEQEEALRAAQAAAEAATAVKAQFLANMSHEIRNPLTAVLGFSDLLRKSSELAAADRTHVERIAGAGSALLAIVNDVLDFSKLESGMVTIAPKPTPIAELARDSLFLFESQAAAKGLELRFEAGEGLPPMVMVDGDRLRQILINLTANAVKFTEHGVVSLRVQSAGNGAVRLDVTDTGPGLTEAECALLFQRFVQIDGSSTRRHGGTGLGLAICKGLTEAMGGHIGVESVVGRGSTFHVTLPAPAVELDDASDAGPDLRPLTGLRILVADDNAANRELAVGLLESLGAKVSVAADGQTALDHLASYAVDILLLDLRMPDMDGPDALRRLRASTGPNATIPVLAFTAEPQQPGGAGLEGFDGIVAKPIDIAALADALVSAVAARRSIT